MYDPVKLQSQSARRQRLRQWFVSPAWIPTFLALIVALLGALGVLPPHWSNWAVVGLAVLSLVAFVIERRPPKSANELIYEEKQQAIKQRKHQLGKKV